MLVPLRLIHPGDACPQGFLPQQSMLNEALEGLLTMDILSTGLINSAESQIVFKVLQGEDLTIDAYVSTLIAPRPGRCCR
jgi:hypothetical protein